MITHNEIQRSQTFYINFLVTLLITFLFIACKNDGKNSTDSHSNDDASIEKESQLEAQKNDALCFASKSEAYDNYYNYNFIRLSIDENDSIVGYNISSPFGTDGFSGSLEGVWNEDKNRFEGKANYIAEGERYSDPRQYQMVEDGIDIGFKDISGNKVILPKVSCEKFDVLFEEYVQQIMSVSLNTKDRTRLKKVVKNANLQFNDNEIETLKFLESYVDLDRNSATGEYLIYIIDPLLCGSGGCNLYIANENGDIISSTTVTRPPVYIPKESIEEERSNKGEWKSIFVYSDGMRMLKPVNETYPTNPSMQPTVNSEMLLQNPHRYRLVMDYVD